MTKYFAPLVLGALAISTSALANPTPDTQDFLKRAVQADRSEVMLAKQAVQNKDTSPEVRAFAQMLVTDHLAHLDKTVALARGNGVTAPDGPSADADAESAKLHLLTGDSFNQEFVHAMVNDHQTAIGDYNTEADRKDGPVSNFAEKTLVTLKKHLEAALKLEKH